MSVNYDGAGGIGIEVDEARLSMLIENGAFTMEDWDYSKVNCMEKIGIEYSVAGNCYTGDLRYYLLINGNTLVDILKNEHLFVEKLKAKGISVERKDLIVISDALIS